MADDAATAFETRPLVVVSNREPYAHVETDSGVAVESTAGGLTAALDPVVGRLGGTWVAWASGDADAQAVDDDGVVPVPPEDPAYDLKRVFLDEEVADAYYEGFANGVLWPLLHSDTARVEFDPDDWAAYVEANERFAAAAADVASPESVVWFQDYHLCLAPAFFDSPAATSQFVHVPWPPAELFAACPRGDRLLDGLLAVDALGFHVETYRENFFDAVERLRPSATVDRQAGVVVADGDPTAVYAQPIGVTVPSGATAETATDSESSEGARVAAAVDDARPLVLGVDRLDYTKGLLERLRALAYLWRTRPEYRGAFTHLALSTPTREGVPAYREYRERVEEAVADVNERFGTPEWAPVEYVTESLPRERLFALYRRADVCLVTSRRDGLNLVALEYALANGEAGGDGASVADADTDAEANVRAGALVVSEFAGASDVLDDAFLVNPYDIEAVADAVASALSLPADERRERAASLARAAAACDVDAWLTANERALSKAREYSE